MGEESLQVGVIGAKVEVLVQEYKAETGQYEPVDISSATELRIQLNRPDTTSVSKPAFPSGDGLDGKIFVITEAGDISMEGTYNIQTYVVLPGWDGYSSISQFEVHDNL